MKKYEQLQTPREKAAHLEDLMTTLYSGLRGCCGQLHAYSDNRELIKRLLQGELERQQAIAKCRST